MAQKTSGRTAFFGYEFASPHTNSDQSNINFEEEALLSCSQIEKQKSASRSWMHSTVSGISKFLKTNVSKIVPESRTSQCQNIEAALVRDGSLNEPSNSKVETADFSNLIELETEESTRLRTDTDFEYDILPLESRSDEEDSCCVETFGHNEVGQKMQVEPGLFSETHNHVQNMTGEPLHSSRFGRILTSRQLDGNVYACLDTNHELCCPKLAPSLNVKLSDLRLSATDLAPIVIEDMMNRLEKRYMRMKKDGINCARRAAADVCEIAGPEVGGVLSLLKIGFGISFLFTGNPILATGMILWGGASLTASYIWGKHRVTISDWLRGNETEFQDLESGVYGGNAKHHLLMHGAPSKAFIDLTVVGADTRNRESGNAERKTTLRTTAPITPLQSTKTGLPKSCCDENHFSKLSTSNDTDENFEEESLSEQSKRARCVRAYRPS